jgi:hypothetical protein
MLTANSDIEAWVKVMINILFGDGSSALLAIHSKSREQQP